MIDSTVRAEFGSTIPAMKIHQLPVGSRFEYEGDEYVKTGPLTGTGNGGQRFIPKYAVLKPLGDVGDVMPEEKSASVSRAAVLDAFEGFHAECRALVAEDRQAALAEARRRFLQTLSACK